jgi:hypothetical protein
MDEVIQHRRQRIKVWFKFNEQILQVKLDGTLLETILRVLSVWLSGCHAGYLPRKSWQYADQYYLIISMRHGACSL